MIRIRLFGPVLFYEMVRLGRRSRYFVIRGLYVLSLLALLYLLQQQLYYRMAIMGPYNVTQVLAEFGESFFFGFTIIQFVAVLTITPALVAGSVAEEKERRTLEYLLTTDLLNREIILGKLLSRLALLLLFLLAGMPVLALSLLFGGISPDLMLCSAAATLVTVFSVASVSMFISVYTRRVRDAVILSYISILAYFVLWAFVEGIRLFLLLGAPPPPLVQVPFQGLTEVLRWGNPFYALYDLTLQIRNSVANPADMAYRLLIRYALVHSLLGILALALALALVRWLYVTQFLEAKAPRRRKKPSSQLVWTSQSEAGPSRPPGFAVAAEESPPKPARKVRVRPPVWNYAVLWKELFVERSLKLGIVGEAALLYFALMLLFPMFVIAGVAFLDLIHQSSGAKQTQIANNEAIRWFGLIVAVLIYLSVALRACNSIASERDRNTMESLLSTPCEIDEIFFAKWLGSLYGARFLAGILGIIWIVGLISGGLHPLALFPSLAVVFILSAFCASLGLYIGVRVRNGVLAQIATVMLIVVLGLGTWLVAVVITDESGRDPYRPPYSYRAVILRSASLFFVTEFIPFCQADLDWPEPSDFRLRRTEEIRFLTWRYLHGGQVAFIFLFMSIYFFLAFVLWVRAVAYFERHCGRTRSRPDRTAPPPCLSTREKAQTTPSIVA